MTLNFQRPSSLISAGKSRGLVIAPGQSIAELYYERQPLYRRYADIPVECDGLTHDQVVGRVIEEVRRQAP